MGFDSVIVCSSFYFLFGLHLGGSCLGGSTSLTGDVVEDFENTKIEGETFSVIAPSIGFAVTISNSSFLLVEESVGRMGYKNIKRHRTGRSS